ncbi:hypothetical protein VPH184E373B_0130 [Vibrio phage 184E37-3b]
MCGKVSSLYFPFVCFDTSNITAIIIYVYTFLSYLS